MRCSNKKVISYNEKGSKGQKLIISMNKEQTTKERREQKACALYTMVVDNSWLSLSFCLWRVRGAHFRGVDQTASSSAVCKLYSAQSGAGSRASASVSSPSLCIYIYIYPKRNVGRCIYIHKCILLLQNAYT